MKNKPSQNLIGQRFGRLTVIEFVGFKIYWKDRRESYWKVKCDCGIEKELRIGNLKKTKSCGCLLDEYRKEILPPITAKRNSKPKGESAQHAVYKTYLNNSKKKNIAFEFTKKEFLDLTQNKCYYCGRQPQTVSGTVVGKNFIRRRNGQFVYNGLDRVDSELGYTKDNIVTCCEICNKAKRDMSQEKFLLWINDLIEYRKIYE